MRGARLGHDSVAWPYEGCADATSRRHRKKAWEDHPASLRRRRSRSPKSSVNYTPPLGAPNSANPVVFLDIALGRYGDATQLGRILIELKKDVVPKTSENFLQLCQKEAGQVQGSIPR